MRQVIVEWDDAVHPAPEWVSLSDVPNHPLRMVSLGWLVRWDSERLLLAQSSGIGEADPTLGGVLTIPAGCVVSVSNVVRGKPVRGSASKISSKASARAAESDG